MNFFGLNSAALNAGVNGVIAGAALVVAASSFAAEATRVVIPEANASGALSVTATASRDTFGRSSFMATSSVSASPALLLLQKADLVATSGFTASNTDAYLATTFTGQAAGFIARPGAGVCAGAASLTADALVTVGFASSFVGTSALSLDPGVKRSGMVTVEREGYATGAGASAMTSSPLRTALATGSAQSVSTFAAAELKTHGGAANLAGVLSFMPSASTDAAFGLSYSYASANGEVTRFFESSAVFTGTLTAEPTALTFSEAATTAASDFTADGRLAELSAAQSTATSSAEVAGVIVRPGAADFVGLAQTSAYGGLIISGDGISAFVSTFTALASTNAEAPDPEERTLRRPFVERTMNRPFVDREMRRPA